MSQSGRGKGKRGGVDISSFDPSAFSLGDDPREYKGDIDDYIGDCKDDPSELARLTAGPDSEFPDSEFYEDKYADPPSVSKTKRKPIRTPVPTRSAIADFFDDKDAATYAVHPDNGLNYFIPTTGKHQGEHIFVLQPRQVPRNPSDFAAIIPSDVRDFNYAGKKQGGINDAGPMGGEYKFRYIIEGERPATIHAHTCVLKQDNGYKNTALAMLNKLSKKIVPVPKQVLNGKVIGEFVASRIMQEMIGDSSSSLFYVVAPDYDKHNKPIRREIPDKTGKHIYLCSPFFSNYRDLFKAIGEAQGIELRSRLKLAGSWNNAIFERGLLETNRNQEIIYRDEQGRITYTRKPQFNSLYQDYKDANGLAISETEALRRGGRPTCLYKDFAEVTIVSLLLGDFDIHTGNLGVVNGRLVRLDQAAALHSLGDSVSLHSILDHLPGIGPTNHYREFPRDMRISKEVAEEAERIANYDPEKIKQATQRAIDETRKFYGAKPFSEFLERLGGINLNELVRGYYDTHPCGMTYDTFYQQFQSGKLEDGLDNGLKEEMAKQVSAYLSKKIISRQASFRKYAFDVKLSLCIKLDKNGEYIINESQYKLKDLIAEYPEYINDDSLHFRSKEQIAHTLFTKNLVDSRVKPTAAEGMRQSMVDTIKEEFGDAAVSHPSGYTARFYTKTATHERVRLVPEHVYHVVVTPRELVAEFPGIAKRQARLQPHLATESASKAGPLRAGQYALNFVDSTSKAGKKGYYVEQITSGNQYQITAHRLPPEIDKTAIATQVLIGLCDSVKLRSDPANMEILQKIAAQLKIREGRLKHSHIDVALKTHLQTLLKDKITLGEIETAFLEKYNEATVTTIKRKDGSVVAAIPSATYLDFAKKQCESFRLTQGEDATICILPRKHEDPLLIQAYRLVCKVYNWKCQDNSNYGKKPHPKFTLDQLEAARVSLRIETTISPKPSPNTGPAHS